MASRDLLEKFSETEKPFVESTQKIPKTEEIELNLGLSLGNSLYRSSSNACGFVKSEEVELSLARSSSLPSDGLGEMRKRKGRELGRHMDVLKRRSEKKEASLPSSQGSIGPAGSGASGISELDNQSAQGSNNPSESRSPASVLSLSEQKEYKSIDEPCLKSAKKSNVTTASDNKPPLGKPKVIVTSTKESDAKLMGQMPCVFTRGDGPDGKRIDGLLFKYSKGEEVRIVCVCHGSFLSPAEFVKHAGGGDVAHPLRHIVVVPSPTSSL